MREKLEKILFVSNNSLSIENVGKKILPELGYLAIVTSWGDSALQAVKSVKHNINLLIIDWDSTDNKSLDLLTEINELDLALPVVFLIDEAIKSIPAEVINLGVRKILYKPVQSNEIANVIDWIFESKRFRDQKANLTTRLKEQYIWMTALNDAGRYIVSSMDIDEIALRTVEVGLNLTFSDQGAVALFDQETGKLHIRATKSLADQSPQLLETPVINSFIDSVISNAKPCRIFKDQSTQSLNNGTGKHVDSLIHVPICFHDEVFGVLTVSRMSGDRLSSAEESKLVSIADYASVAIRNSRSHQTMANEYNDHLVLKRHLVMEEERYSLAAKAAKFGLWDWDFKTNQIYYSADWKSISGYQNGEIGQTMHDWLDRVHPHDQERVKLELAACIDSAGPRFVSEYRFMHKDGTYRWILNQATVLRKGGGVASRLVGVHVDITERKQYEESLLYSAYHDVITGLLNRPIFMNRLDHTLIRYRRKKTHSLPFFHWN